MTAERVGLDIAQLVAEHHQAVYRYAYRLTGSVPDAEDLCQQVFLIAQQKAGQMRNLQSARKWLYVVLRNRFLKEAARWQPALAGSLEINMDHLPAQVPAGAEIDRQRLQAAIGELPLPYRVVLLMYYFEDCAYREIAEQLNLPIGTVMSRLARAKTHLRARLFASGHPVPPHAASPRG